MKLTNKILEVKNLKTSFFTKLGEVKALSGVSFDVDEGEVLAIVGESGSGKSVTALSIIDLLTHPGEIVSGSIVFDNKELTKLKEKQMQKIRGKMIGTIFQDPMTSLNPVLSIGLQIKEVLKFHENMTEKKATSRALEMLKLVGISDPESAIKQYPHEFSGGMRQRVMIAIALACNPKLLIADEPTTALDVTIQAQILDLMKDLIKKFNTSIILITHDLGIVAGMADNVIVMYGGNVVEKGSVKDIFYNPKHPYTWGLLKAIPKLNLEEKQNLFPIDGQPPDLLVPPRGCPFYDRCDYAMEVCEEKNPGYFKIKEGHKANCWLLHPDAPEVKRKVR